MQHKWVLLVAGATLAFHSTAHAGAPAWCKGTEKFDAGDYARAQDDSARVSYLVDHCQSDSDKARGDESKRLYMNDADWNDAATWDNEHGPSSTEVGGKVLASTFATLSPVDQYLLINKGVRDGVAGADALYLTDALEQSLTEAGRLAFLESCNLGGTPQPALWSLCMPDAAKFDPNKFAAEVRGDTSHTPKERFALRVRLGAMFDGLRKLKEAESGLIKKDDAYKKLFDTAAQAHADWDKTVGTMKDLLALAQQVDSAWYFHSKKQLAGCEAKSEKALADAVSKIPAKTFTGMRDDFNDINTNFANAATPKILTFPEASLAANVFAECEPDRAWSYAIAATLEWMPGQRGPRSASYTAIIAQKFALDDTREGEISMPKVGPRPYGTSTSGIQSYGGVVAKLTPSNDGPTGAPVVVIAEPKSSITSEDCVKWHETSKHIGWDTAGRPTFEQICDKTAMVKHDTTPQNTSVTAASAAMLKVGMRFSVLSAHESGQLRDVYAVWPKTAKLPSMVLGGAVK